MKLSVEKRVTGKKGVTNQIRRDGNIPAIVYGVNQPAAAITVSGNEIKALLRNVKQGLLATTIFEIDVDGKSQKAVLKDIQYNVATYDVEHMDFILLNDEHPVTLNVPITLHGVADCAGVKLGGFLRQVIRSMKVSCLPKNIPQEFVIDVKDLSIAQSKMLADIPMPQGVSPLVKLNEVAVVIGKKAGS